MIEESVCLGCGYCDLFCNRDCIKLSSTRFNEIGYAMAEVVRPENCNGCGNCAMMCPQFAIEVYQIA